MNPGKNSDVTDGLETQLGLNEAPQINALCHIWHSDTCPIILGAFVPGFPMMEVILELQSLLR